MAARNTQSSAESRHPGSFLDRRSVIAALVLTALLSLPFIAWPELDLAASSVFFDPATGFVGARSALVGFVRDAGRLVEAAWFAAAVVPLLIVIAAPGSRLLVRPRVPLFLAAAYLLGPGLVVNLILKEHWGRARPRQIEAFGGEAAFSPAWAVSDACATNCSFVSGEASSAFWLLTAAFLAPPRWRSRVAASALLIYAAVSLARLAAGAHFLSDVLIAGSLTLSFIVALHRPIMTRLPESFDRCVQRALARFGRALREPWRPL